MFEPNLLTTGDGLFYVLIIPHWFLSLALNAPKSTIFGIRTSFLFFVSLAKSSSVRCSWTSQKRLSLNWSLLMLEMPSGSSLHCTADDINPSGSTSLQPLDISIDISLSALTLKGVTFHLHTMLIKIHPYVLKKKGWERGEGGTLHQPSLRRGLEWQIGWSNG